MTCPCTPPNLPDCAQARLHAGCAVRHSAKAVLALSRCRVARVVFVVGLFAAVTVLLSGCHGVPANPAPAASAPIVASQEGKDTAVLAEAAKIDSIAPGAKPHTDAQRAAVAAAPAADVAKMASDFENQFRDATKLIETRTRERDEARNQTDRTILVSGYALAALLTASGVATFFLLAQFAFLGPRVGFALIAAGVSVFSLLQAYQWTKAHPWAVGVALLCVVVAGSLAFANHLHAKTP